MVIDLPLHVEQMIIHEAQTKGVSVAELIEKWANQAQKNQAGSLYDFVQNLPNRSHLGDCIHQIFAETDYPQLDISERTEYLREQAA